MQPGIVKKRLLISALSAPVAMGVLTVILLWHLRVQRIYTHWLEHSEQVLNEAVVAKSRILEVQGAFRGYVASPQPDYLNELKRAQEKTQASLRILAGAVLDNPFQESRLLEISSREGKWQVDLQRGLDNEIAAVQAGSILKQVQPSTDSLLASLDDFIDAERQVEIVRFARRQSEDLLVLWLVPIASAAVALLLILVSWRDIAAVVRQYQMALEQSEQANLRTNNFLATVSHELRNPLNLILLWSRLLLSNLRDEDKTTRGLNAIDRAAQSQAQLIEDLLEFSKIESGRLRLDLQVTDLPAVVRAGVEAMMPAAEAKAIDLQVIVDPRAGMIMGDPHRLQQALWNLLSNAVKFTPKGGRIQVRLVRINSHLELSVSDTGQGIEVPLLPHVFDRFWQAEAGPASQKKGMGLGLTIVKHVVTMHGGSISALSGGPGTGATFTVRLPLPIMTQGFQPARHTHPMAATVPGIVRIPQLTGLQIIVVDDDREATEALGALLKSLGAQALVADSADRALQLLSEHRPDAVVSDIGMPGRDGLSLAREIRSSEQKAGNGHLPLVALTAYGRVEDKVEIFAAGFDGHVTKPADPAELAAVIKSVVEPNRDRS